MMPASAFAQIASAPIDASTIVALTNADRATQGVDALTESALLDIAAQKKANDMATHGYFAHYSPSGVSPWHWFTSVGYYYTHAGENLAIDFNDPETLEAAWMASPAHRANILRGIYTQMGIGIAQGLYQGKLMTFVVEFFATPSARKTS